MPTKPKKSGKQMLKELPIAGLSPAMQKNLLLELIDCFRDGFEAPARTNEVYIDCVATFDKYGVDVQPDSVTR